MAESERPDTGTENTKVPADSPRRCRAPANTSLIAVNTASLTVALPVVSGELIQRRRYRRVDVASAKLV